MNEPKLIKKDRLCEFCLNSQDCKLKLQPFGRVVKCPKFHDGSKQYHKNTAKEIDNYGRINEKK